MHRLWMVLAAALALALFQPDSVFAQRGGARAGGGSSGLHGSTMNRGFAVNRGVGVPQAGMPQAGVPRAGVAANAAAVTPGSLGRSGWGWRSGWGFRRGLGWPLAVGVVGGGWDYELNSDECLFWTHHGWINTCF